MRYPIFVGGVVFLILLGLLWQPPGALAQATQPGDNVTLTREEYNALMRRLDNVEGQLRAATQSAKPQVGPTQAELDQAVEDVNKDIRTNRDMIRAIRPGSSTFTLVGDGDITYSSQKNGDSTFDVGIAPLILWQLGPRFLVEVGVDISLSSDSATGESSTDVELMISNITYTVNNCLWVGGGLFVEPFGRYHNNFDPSWINPLPDDPLVFGDRSIAPERGLGVFVGGAVPIGSQSKLVYNVYVTNGPQVTNTGEIDWDNFSDNNSGKGYGGRIGFLPIPEFEIGYSVQYGQADLPESGSVDVLAQAVDAQYKKDIAPLGLIEVRGEWVFVNIDEGLYPDSGLTFPFSNDGNGGYVLVGYRPTRADSKVLRNVEFVARYDILTVNDRIGGKEERWAFGIDYWLTPSIVLKAAYEFDNPDLGPAQDGFFVQCGFGL